VSGGEDFSGELVVLAADIDFGGEMISPVGNDDNCFKGIFDGRGHRIKNADITSGDGIYSGLFSCVSGKGSVFGVTMENCTVRGMSAGGICGRADCFEIRKCAFYGEVSGADYEGGIAAEGSGVMISDCIADKTESLDQDITERVYPTAGYSKALSDGLWECSGGVMHENRSVYEHAYGIQAREFMSGGIHFYSVRSGIMETPAFAVIKAAIQGLKAIPRV
jgi:uncharacterized cupin superfamily protein